VRLVAELGRSLLMAGEPAKAAVVIDEALVIAEQLGLRETIAELLASKGWALGATLRPIEASALLLGAVTFAERGGWARAEFRSRMNYSAWASWEDTREGFDVARTGVERARALGMDQWAASLAGNAFNMAVMLGEWDWLDRAVNDFGFEDQTDPWAMSPLGNYTAVLAYRGEWRRAEDAAAKITEAIGTLEDMQLQSARYSMELELSFAKGDLDAADAAARRLGAILAPLGLDDSLAIAPIALERRDLAGARLAAASRRSGRLRDAVIDGVAAGTDVLAGDLTRLAAMDAAIAVVWGAGARFMAAEFDRARAMLAPEDPGARAAAARAAAVFRELGAVTLLRGLDNLLDTPADPVATTRSEEPAAR
jgi:hypothetical protein